MASRVIFATCTNYESQEDFFVAPHVHPHFIIAVLNQFPVNKPTFIHKDIFDYIQRNAGFPIVEGKPLQAISLECDLKGGLLCQALMRMDAQMFRVALQNQYLKITYNVSAADENELAKLTVKKIQEIIDRGNCVGRKYNVITVDNMDSALKIKTALSMFLNSDNITLMEIDGKIVVEYVF